MPDPLSRSDRNRLLLLVLLGVLIRLGFLVLAEPLELWADEGQYIYQALAWNRFGFYLGSVDWVWPPGYPAYLALGFRLFGEGGIFAAKLGQVLLSGVVGLSMMFLARRLFPARAMRVATLTGFLWAVYLPLIGFSHYLWPETVFLALLVPAITLFLSAMEGGSRPELRMLGAGLCLGSCFLLKESVLPLLAFLPCLALGWTPRAAHDDKGELVSRRGLGQRACLALILPLAALSTFLPWTLRNHEVYGHWVPSGATLGENVYQGLNADYQNYDYAGAPAITRLDPEGWVHRWLVRWPEQAERWPRSLTPNTIDKNSENIAAGKRFALDHPGFFLRSRVKKVADWLTPLNFIQRQLRLGVYDEPLGKRSVRRFLVLGSTAETALVLLFGTGALFLAVRRSRHRLLLMAVLGTFLSGALVVSMSRYRAPVEPFLLVLAAGLLGGVPCRVSKSARCWSAALVALLLFFWFLNAPEVARMLRESLT